MHWYQITFQHYISLVSYYYCTALQKKKKYIYHMVGVWNWAYHVGKLYTYTYNREYMCVYHNKFKNHESRKKNQWNMPLLLKYYLHQHNHTQIYAHNYNKQMYHVHTYKQRKDRNVSFNLFVHYIVITNRYNFDNIY